MSGIRIRYITISSAPSAVAVEKWFLKNHPPQCEILEICVSGASHEPCRLIYSIPDELLHVVPLRLGAIKIPFRTDSD